MSNSSRPIRVLRIISRMNVGGPAVQVTTICQGLPKNLYHQRLLIGECERDEADFLNNSQNEMSLKMIPGLGRKIKPFSDLKALVLIWKEIRAFHPDIIHTHTFKAGFLGRLALVFLRNKPNSVHTYHGHLLYGYWKGAKLKALIAIERFLASRTDVLISVGEQVKFDLIEKKIGKPNQYRVIPPGFQISSDVLRASSIRSEAERKNGFICLWVGRMVRIKRPDRLVELAREMKNRNLPITIWVVGDGPYRALLESVAKIENLPLSILGWRSDVIQLLLQSDSLVLTSDNEGTPVSIIEAQRLGRPVIATAVGSVSEVLVNEESGFVIDFSAARFVDKLEILLKNNDTYIGQSNYAKRFANHKFSATRLIEDHLLVYRELTNS